MQDRQYQRLLRLDSIRSSCFLFGPRMTGKTSLVTKQITADLKLNLLDLEIEQQLRLEPKIFSEYLKALKKGSTVVVDEVQRIPELLNYVQIGIDQYGLKFVLTGSSARKLKRGGANLLGGRAVELFLHPLTVEELGPDFDLLLALRFGTLPKVFQLLAEDANKEAVLQEVRRILRAYYSIYIKEEIQAEALTRNIAAFQRFLQVAAQSNATIIEYANIGRDASVVDSTVKEYFSILEDTLVGNFLWPWDTSERKKARPKFYFFDCGVLQAIRGHLTDIPGSREMGNLFETFFIREIHRIRDYKEYEHRFSFWRERDNEIDLLIENHRGIALAIEIKSSRGELDITSLQAFKRKFPKVPILVASMVEEHERITEEGFRIVPLRQALIEYEAS